MFLAEMEVSLILDNDLLGKTTSFADICYLKKSCLEFDMRKNNLLQHLYWINSHSYDCHMCRHLMYFLFQNNEDHPSI